MSGPPTAIRVLCLGCGQLMRPHRPLATVAWTWPDGQESEQTYIEYQCDTPDCGTVAQVEAS